MKIGRIKGRKILLPAVLGAVIVSFGVSLSVYAESAINSKLDVVMSEPIQWQVAANQSTLKEDTLQPPLASVAVQEIEDLEEAVAASFVQAAIAGFEGQNIQVPADGYTLKSTVDRSEGVVTLFWYPDIFDEVGPLQTMSGSVYMAKFTEVNLEEGTGHLTTLREIKEMQVSGQGDTVYTIKIKPQ